LPIDGHSFRRIEVLTGVPRRRRWSAAEKAAIVAESLAPGAVVSTVALRRGLYRMLTDGTSFLADKAAAAAAR
jgi:transposase